MGRQRPAATGGRPRSGSERVEFFRPLPGSGVELFRLENATRIRLAYHETYALRFVPESENEPDAGWEGRSGGRPVWLRPGDIALTEPGELYVVTRIRKPTTSWSMWIEPTTMARIGIEIGLGSTPRFRTRELRSRSLAAGLEQFFDDVRRGALADPEARLRDTLRVVLERSAAEAPVAEVDAGRPVGRARDYLHAHVSDRVALAELSRVSGASSFHLARSFTRLLGVAPHAYQIQLRLAACRDELRNGVPLARASADVGFADQSHFGRLFKRHVGVTPGEFAGRRSSPMASSVLSSHTTAGCTGSGSR